MLTAIGIKKKCKRLDILFIELDKKQASRLIKKLQNYLYFRAPKPGGIKTLGVQEGDSILANHLLFEIE